MNLLVLGANSDAAHAIATTFAREERADLYLASRDMALLEKRAADIRVRCDVRTRALFFDAEDPDSHRAFYEALDPRPDGVALAFGRLGDQERAQRDFAEARRILETNFVGAVSILEIIAADFERRGHGFIIGLGSVAGERGRQSNYVYGAAKGALALYLSGLRNRLSARGVRVMTVLPGFIRTKMTEGMALPGMLVAEPGDVARDVHRAFKRGRNVVYTRWFWRWIMWSVKMIPEALFKRMKL